ncbi:hypothetical protein B0H13DRAFT_1986556 [Mycena leptocephala]|nr:hypothetical protein B0H13DRAFT_1986556 [Mycena leptocephala]
MTVLLKTCPVPPRQSLSTPHPARANTYETGRSATHAEARRGAGDIYTTCSRLVAAQRNSILSRHACTLRVPAAADDPASSGLTLAGTRLTCMRSHEKRPRGEDACRIVWCMPAHRATYVGNAVDSGVRPASLTIPPRGRTRRRERGYVVYGIPSPEFVLGLRSLACGQRGYLRVRDRSR